MQCEGSFAETFGGAEVLITGGFGFIGGHLTARLVELGAWVSVLDLDAGLDRTSLINLVPGLRDAVRVIEGDVSDMPLVRGLIEAGRFAAVFNTASYASVIERAVAAPYETIRTNTLGLVNLLESVRGLPPEDRPTRIVHLSTDKVYGDSGGEPYDEEGSRLRATGVYDVAKLASDAFARLYHTAYGLPTAVIRLCNIFGPADFNMAYRVIPKAMARLFEHDRPEPPELYEGSRTHGRDYLYVGDCVRVLLALATEPACAGGVFNLAGCKYLKTPQLLESVVRIAAEVEGRHDPRRAEAIRANGYRTIPQGSAGVVTIADQHATGRRLVEATGFAPLTTFDAGLALTAEWYRAHLGASPRAPGRQSSLKVQCR